MAKKRKKQDDDISLDFQKMGAFLKKVNISNDRLITMGILLAVIVLIFSIRVIPMSLPVTEVWAEQSITQGIRQQASQQINAQFPALPQDNKDKMINQQIAQVKEQQAAEIAQAKIQLSEQFKSRLRYVGEDGEEHTYLGDLDSYFWIRYTRNWLEHGNVCDEVIDGECWDNHLLAPVGNAIKFNPSLHIFAIGALHKTITIFNPNYPLPATSFWIPILIGTLGVIPAFFIGRRLAGNTGGIFSAILVSLHPLFLSRSMGSDNDVWNVVLPLFIMWMAVEALEAQDTKRRIIYGALAGFFVGVHAATWAGWWFIYLIILFAMVAFLGFRIAFDVIRKKSHKVWKDKNVIAAGIVLVTFYIASFIFLALFSGESISNYVSKPGLVLVKAQNLDRAVSDAYWPNVLTTVAELNKSSLKGAMTQMGGKMMFLGAMIGLLLMILPRKLKNWRWEQYSILAVGAGIFIYLVNNPGLSKFTILILLGLPIAIAVILDLLRDYKIDVAVSFVVLVWFAATIYASYSGVRFILLMVPVYGAAFAVFAGRIYEWVTDFSKKELDWQPMLVSIIVFIIIGTLLVVPVKAGYGTSRGFMPTIDDGWWDTLTKIREESAPDAIINSWWDFGHWFKYVADRAVSADGTTQHTHVPRWLGLSLITPDEKISVGTIRMLNCGSDAFPEPEGKDGAYGRILSMREDPIVSQDILLEIVKLEEDDADDRLEELEFTEEQREFILEKTHCAAREDYYITSGDMVGKAGVWAHFGLWDFQKAYVVAESTQMSRQIAIDDLVSKFGMKEDQASKLYSEAIGLRTEAQKNAFVAPWPGYITQSWRSGCKIQADNITTVCPLNIGLNNQNGVVTALASFTYNSSQKNSSTLRYTAIQNGIVTGSQDEMPGVLIIAGEELEEFVFSGSRNPSLGVLFDQEKNRILVGDPALLRSVFTQLFFLEGRYNQHFDKFDDRTTVTGVRILTWKVDWDGKEN